ncbi:DUF3891 family protein [Neolewinella maritima]|nr:DUF3891 family protein [Neolewinella maritima]
MLVRPHPAGWRITLHPAHGFLAADLFGHLAVALPEELLLPTLLAVAEHDDHQLDFRTGDYLTERGAPRDFSLMDTEDAQRSLQSEALLADAHRKHAWTYLLLGMHYEFLYAGQSVDERLKALLKDIATRRKQLLRQRHWKQKVLATTYGYLRFCDRLSLILCGEDVPTLGRQLEINDALGKVHYLRQQPDTERLTVTPWPFTTDRFTVRGESFVVQQLAFASSAALGDVLRDTVAEVREWEFVRQAD